MLSHLVPAFAVNRHGRQRRPGALPPSRDFLGESAMVKLRESRLAATANFA